MSPSKEYRRNIYMHESAITRAKREGRGLSIIHGFAYMVHATLNWKGIDCDN